MSNTKDLMLAKLQETGDQPEEVICEFDLGENRFKCSLQELPDGYLISFCARSDNFHYVPNPSGEIAAWDNDIVRYLT